jgi:DNA-binding transcriptional ArsR family regulator
MAMRDQPQKKNLDRQLAQVISHEITVKVLTVLAERAASPKEIGQILREKVPTISHHVKKLERMGLAELIEEKEIRGAVQHIYRAVIRPIVSTEEWDKLTIAERQQFSIWIVQLILADAARSFDASLFDARSNRHLSRTPMVVDEKGLDEVAEIQNRAMNEILEVQAIASERRLRSGAPAIDVIAAMLCFELPGPSKLNSLGRDANGTPMPRFAGDRKSEERTDHQRKDLV